MQTRKHTAQHDHHDGGHHCKEHRANGDRKSKDTNAQPAEESCGGDNDADECKRGHVPDLSLLDSNGLRAAAPPRDQSALKRPLKMVSRCVGHSETALV